MTDAVQTALIVAIAPTILALGSFIKSWRNGDDIKDVKTDTVAIHALSNKAMGAALGVGAVALRQLADSSPENQSYQERAVQAEKEYKAHLASQNKLDEALSKKKP